MNFLGANGYGDPHYVPFNGMGNEFTFNGAGEYTLLKTAAQGFQLQGRLGPRGFPATFMVSLAFGIPGVYGYQVSYIPMVSKLILIMAELTLRMLEVVTCACKFCVIFQQKTRNQLHTTLLIAFQKPCS